MGFLHSALTGTTLCVLRVSNKKYVGQDRISGRTTTTTRRARFSQRIHLNDGDSFCCHRRTRTSSQPSNSYYLSDEISLRRRLTPRVSSTSDNGVYLTFPTSESEQPPTHTARCRRRGRVRETVSEVNPGCARLEKGMGRRFASRPRTDEAVCVQQSMLRQQVDSIEQFHRLHYCLLCDNKLAVGRNKP